MNTAACLSSELVVSPAEPVRATPENAEPEADSAPPRRLDVLLKIPNDRDFEIYEQVAIDGLAQRLVAQKHGISQPRVNQILREMAGWMADNTPAFAASLTPVQQLRLVHYNVTQQLEHQRCALMRAWRKSIGIEKVTRTTMVGNIRQTVEFARPSQGNPRYLREATRVSLAQLKMAGWKPNVLIPPAPQNSPYWEIVDEGEDEKQTAESEQPTGEPGEAESGLSSFAERAADPNLTRAEMDAITAEQEATCAALQAKIKQLEAAVQKSQNSLSPGTGPLLPEGKKVPLRDKKANEKDDPRQNFLRGEPQVMSLRDFLDQKK